MENRILTWTMISRVSLNSCWNFHSDIARVMMWTRVFWGNKSLTLSKFFFHSGTILVFSTKVPRGNVVKRGWKWSQSFSSPVSVIRPPNKKNFSICHSTFFLCWLLFSICYRFLYGTISDEIYYSIALMLYVGLKIEYYEMKTSRLQYILLFWLHG